MRHRLALPIAALVGAACAAPILVATRSSASPELAASAPSTVQERYGVVRYDTAAHKWAILATPVFRSYGLSGVSCSTSSGLLTIGFTPLTTIGTFTVDEDEAYTGRYAAGASITPKSLTITIRKASNGATVSCNAKEVRIANSSLQVWVRGSLAPPPTSPAPRPSTLPPSSPTPSRPSSRPPTLPPTSPVPSSVPAPPTADPGDSLRARPVS